MRENLGWKIAWVNDSIGNPQDVFCTPYTEFSRKRKIMVSFAMLFTSFISNLLL
jgi:hypothetical protein